MGRWRPAARPSSPYITATGYARLEAELKQLWQRRSDVVAALSAAAAEGDRSENAEYLYRKKELGGLDRRIRYLQKRLPELRVVREFAGGERVFFGAWVEVENAAGQRGRYRIVGPDEAASAPEFLSMDAPLAVALLKRGPGDEVKVVRDAETLHYSIISVSYAGDAD